MVRTGMYLHGHVGIPRAVQRRGDTFRAPGRLHALVIRAVNEEHGNADARPPLERPVSCKHRRKDPVRVVGWRRWEEPRTIAQRGGERVQAHARLSLYATATSSRTYSLASAESCAEAASGYTALSTLNTSMESAGSPAAAEPITNATDERAATIGAMVAP